MYYIFGEQVSYSHSPLPVAEFHCYTSTKSFVIVTCRLAILLLRIHMLPTRS